MEDLEKALVFLIWVIGIIMAVYFTLDANFWHPENYSSGDIYDEQPASWSSGIYSD